LTHEDDGPNGAPETPRDVLTRWRYTLTPTLYVNETSDVQELLWQHVLEQRAQRAWLVVIFVTLALLVVIVVTFTLVVAVAAR
jgi:hypothetical protein